MRSGDAKHKARHKAKHEAKHKAEPTGVRRTSLSGRGTAFLAAAGMTLAALAAGSAVPGTASGTSAAADSGGRATASAEAVLAADALGDRGSTPVSRSASRIAAAGMVDAAVFADAESLTWGESADNQQAQAAARAARARAVAHRKALARAAARRADARAAAQAREAARERAQAAAAAQAAAEQVAAAAATDPGTLRDQARGWMIGYGFSADQWPYLDRLVTRESGWRVTASNTSSGAYGLPQALPGSKMASVAGDWRTNPHTQLVWMFGYIRDRYGNPQNAWGHSEEAGWY